MAVVWSGLRQVPEECATSSSCVSGCWNLCWKDRCEIQGLFLLMSWEKLSLEGFYWKNLAFLAVLGCPGSEML